MVVRLGVTRSNVVHFLATWVFLMNERTICAFLVGIEQDVAGCSSNVGFVLSYCRFYVELSALVVDRFTATI